MRAGQLHKLVEPIVNDYVDLHGTNTDLFLLKREVALGVTRDIQARLLPPNVKVPSRKRTFTYLRTIHSHTGSLRSALSSWLNAGSWTSSGGSFRLASDNGIDIEAILRKAIGVFGSANFLEIGAGYAGFCGGGQPGGASIRSLYEDLRAEGGLEVAFHFTNLTKWHRELPDGVHEHPGVLGSTISRVSRHCDQFDVVYSQCSVYFDPNINSFVRQVAGLVRPSLNGGFVVFNANSNDVAPLCHTAGTVRLRPVWQKHLGGMNGTLLVFKKAGSVSGSGC